MSIRSISNPYGPQRPTTSTQSGNVRGSSDAAPASPATSTPDASVHGRPARSDSVSISDAGRSLASGSAKASSSLTPERVSELRKKVLEGAYNSTHVVDAVAKRLLSNGDV